LASSMTSQEKHSILTHLMDVNVEGRSAPLGEV
jgi:hypothetical protein